MLQKTYKEIHSLMRTQYLKLKLSMDIYLILKIRIKQKDDLTTYIEPTQLECNDIL